MGSWKECFDAFEVEMKKIMIVFVANHKPTAKLICMRACNICTVNMCPS